jgi:hypothetical protein
MSKSEPSANVLSTSKLDRYDTEEYHPIDTTKSKSARRHHLRSNPPPRPSLT